MSTFDSALSTLSDIATAGFLITTMCIGAAFFFPEALEYVLSSL